GLGRAGKCLPTGGVGTRGMTPRMGAGDAAPRVCERPLTSGFRSGSRARPGPREAGGATGVARLVMRAAGDTSVWRVAEEYAQVEWDAGPQDRNDADLRPERDRDPGDGDRGGPLHCDAGEVRGHRWLRGGATRLRHEEAPDPPRAGPPGARAARDRAA